MKTFCLLLLVALSQALPRDEWESFKKIHGKKYKTVEEENMRKEVFHKNRQLIEEHNKNFHDGLVTFKLKMNRFGDLMNDEFRSMMNKYNSTQATRRNYGSTFIPAANVKLPESIDWRQKGAVTPVKDQAQCGSCWAFSTTGSLEGQHFRKTGKLVSLSEQNLVDCSRNYGNNGCSGGLMDDAFQYISANGGLDTEDSYPYEGRDGRCKFQKTQVGATVSGFIDIPQGDEEALKNAVGTVGPVSVAIDAGEDSFRFYDSGVYHESRCSPTGLDHGVLTVGYGSENGQDYWLVKNSWGPSWGEAGYIKMARNSRNMCGIASMASYPRV